MSGIAGLILAAQVACSPTPITQDEARTLALLVGKANAVKGLNWLQAHPNRLAAIKIERFE